MSARRWAPVRHRELRAGGLRVPAPRVGPRGRPCNGDGRPLRPGVQAPPRGTARNLTSHLAPTPLFTQPAPEWVTGKPTKERTPPAHIVVRTTATTDSQHVRPPCSSSHQHHLTFSFPLKFTLHFLKKNLICNNATAVFFPALETAFIPGGSLHSSLRIGGPPHEDTGPCPGHPHQSPHVSLLAANFLKTENGLL